MWEIRQLVLRLLEELGMTRAELCRELNRVYRGYSLHESELSKYLNGKSSTPKAHRTLEDALALLTKEHKRRNKLVEAAKASLETSA